MGARGKNRRNSSMKRGKRFDKTKKPRSKNKSTNGRDIKHRDQYKRPLPDEVNEKAFKRRKVQEESSEESEAEDAYKLLLSTFNNAAQKIKSSVESESESDNECASDDEIDELSDHGEPNLPSQEIDSENEEDELGSHASDDSDDNDITELETNTSIAGQKKSDDDSPQISSEEEESDESSDDLKDDIQDTETIHEEVQDGEEQDDPFVKHIHFELSEEAAEFLSQLKPPSTQEEITWSTLGRLIVSIPQIPIPIPSNHPLSGNLSLEGPKKYAERGSTPNQLSQVDWEALHLKTQLRDHVAKANFSNLEVSENSMPLTPLQLELFTLMSNYQDIYCPERTLKNGEQVRLAYCLHVANHVIKTRNTVLHHNARLNKKNCADVPDDFRDQGLVRPKVLILVPFREQARRVVEMLISLLVPGDAKGGVMNRKRFDEEFGGESLDMPKKNPRPEDYEETFTGNTDDTFRLGITVTKKCLKLYADFYSSDIIISSPLGLRMLVGAEGESDRDYDFLASIEILVLDQADVFLMQNWDHLLHVLDHLHLQPREAHGTDFSRVRPWAVNGWARFYRQTILFSSIALPEFSALMNKRCLNYAGFIRQANPISSGTICHVIVQLPQVFQRLEASSVASSLEARFDYLTKKVLPEHIDPIMAHTMIYVPSYFDYVRIRNYLRKQDMSFVQICEYSKDNKVARARDMFYHSQVQLLLYSERFHFFRRPRIKGIRHIIFYQPPTLPHFYSEMCNLMQEGNQNPRGGSESNMTVTVLYSRYDAPQLSAVVGSERASRMLTSDRNVHMFMTGD